MNCDGDSSIQHYRLARNLPVLFICRCQISGISQCQVSGNSQRGEIHETTRYCVDPNLCFVCLSFSGRHTYDRQSDSVTIAHVHDAEHQHEQQHCYNDFAGGS